MFLLGATGRHALLACTHAACLQRPLLPALVAAVAQFWQRAHCKYRAFSLCLRWPGMRCRIATTTAFAAASESAIGRVAGGVCRSLQLKTGVKAVKRPAGRGEHGQSKMRARSLMVLVPARTTASIAHPCPPAARPDWVLCSCADKAFPSFLAVNGNLLCYSKCNDTTEYQIASPQPECCSKTCPDGYPVSVSQ